MVAKTVAIDSHDHDESVEHGEVPSSLDNTDSSVAELLQVKPPPRLDSLEENLVMFEWKTPLQVACAWGPDSTRWKGIP